MENKYIPALKYHFLTPYYDWVIRCLMPEGRVKRKIIALLNLQNHEKLLDFGCGTGTLLEILSATNPEVKAYGYDVDPVILGIARKKNLGNSQLILGVEERLPFPDHHFEKVTSSWVFHHLDEPQKQQAFSELYRILKPGGLMIIADWGKPANFLMRFLFFLIQLVDNFHTTGDNVAGKLPDYMTAAGFNQVEAVGSKNTLFGTLVFYEGRKEEGKRRE
jgi:ubiquinone/menaquinone biosynthesis C-methylase UbiE